MRDSITGFGTIIGETTGKVLDYGVKSTRCRKCELSLTKVSLMTAEKITPAIKSLWSLKLLSSA